jgi:hypothetical protein
VYARLDRHVCDIQDTGNVGSELVKGVWGSWQRDQVAALLHDNRLLDSILVEDISVVHHYFPKAQCHKKL